MRRLRIITLKSLRVSVMNTYRITTKYDFMDSQITSDSQGDCII